MELGGVIEAVTLALNSKTHSALFWHFPRLIKIRILNYRVYGQKKRNSKTIKGFAPSSSCKLLPDCFVIACLRYFQQASLCALCF